jgi:hypothetical protein
MYKILFGILLFINLAAFAQPKKYILRPDAQGFLIINSTTYKPGDTIALSGYFKAVAIYNLAGSDGNTIKITNLPGETLIIGDSAWSGGSWAHGLAMRNCHYIEIYGNAQKNFKITGANTTTKDANGYPVKTAYFDLIIGEMSDNFKVHDISIRHGGTGIHCKTEITSNSNTWYPNIYLNNFEFYNIDIYNTYNEAMYIGHTATYWNISNNTPYYPGPNITPDPVIYKQPIKLKNVKIHHNYIHDIGNDGIQTAAIDGLEIYNNEVYNWATKQGSADNGGILIGGRVKGFNVHDNYVHDGWGEMVQVYAEGGAEATIKNNLFVRNKSEGVSIRGTNGLLVNFTNNTIAYTGGNAIRINGYFGGTGSNLLQKNIIAQPTGNYIYLENAGAVQDVDNLKYTLASQALWMETNYYQPLANSPAIGYGYIVNQIPSANSALKVTINIPPITLDKLTEGSYVMKLTMPDGKVVFVTIVVEKAQ